MTGDLCIQHCNKGKYELAAVRATDCTCGLGIPIDSDYYHDYRCRMPCPGDSRQVCGGYTEGRLMVYKSEWHHQYGFINTNVSESCVCARVCVLKKKHRRNSAIPSNWRFINDFLSFFQERLTTHFSFFFSSANTGFCRHPGDPANGKRQDDYFRFGAKVKFRCNTGYKLLGNTTIQCIPRDQTQRPIKSLAWDGIAPVCIGKNEQFTRNM